MPAVAAIVGLVDNCSLAFPKVGHLASGLLSLLVCRRPCAALSCLNGSMFVKSLEYYLRDVFRLVHNSECWREEYFGVVAFLNILPAIYHFGNWKEAQASTRFNRFIGILVSFIMNMAHSATGQEDGIDDDPRDLETFPELISANVVMEGLLVMTEDEEEEVTSSGADADNNTEEQQHRP
jgi:hypothetical protein